MVQAIILYGFVVEPRTIASLPPQATNHAELCAAATCHVVTSFFQLYSRRAVEASLPTLFLCDLSETSRRFVFRAFFPSVPAPIAGAANFCTAASTSSILPPTIGAPRSVGVDVCGFDPFAAAASWTIYTIFSGILLILLVPCLLELKVKKTINVFERYVLGGAAFRWHVLRVCDRERKDATEAGVTHAMLTSQFCGTRDRYI